MNTSASAINAVDQPESKPGLPIEADVDEDADQSGIAHREESVGAAHDEMGRAAGSIVWSGGHWCQAEGRFGSLRRAQRGRRRKQRGSPDLVLLVRAAQEGVPNPRQAGRHPVRTVFGNGKT